jgi:hypothetical protein
MMKRHVAVLLMVLAGMAGRQAQAEISVYDSCTDASGRTIPAQMDFTLVKVVQSGVEAGQPVIRYNPQALARLSDKGRLFFFAQECARFALHNEAAGDPTPAQAHRADCLGVAMLTDAGLLTDPDGIKALQSELSFSQSEWDQLPLPQRTFDFSTCVKRSAIKLPAAAMPPEKQLGWNACVRICADRLRSCQTACGGSACVDRCLATYDKCEAACGAP